MLLKMVRHLDGGCGAGPFLFDLSSCLKTSEIIDQVTFRII